MTAPPVLLGANRSALQAGLRLGLGFGFGAYLMALPVLGAGSEEQRPPEGAGELASVNESIGRIQQWINDADNNRSQLEKDLRSADQQIAGLELAITANEEAIDQQDSLLAELRQRSGHLLAQKTEQQMLVSRAVRASYMLGRDSTLKLLLNQEDPGPSARMLRYYAAFNENRLEHIHGYERLLDELDATAAQIDLTAAELAARNVALREQITTLAAARDERSRILASLQQELSSRRTELAQLVQDRQHLESLLEEINQIVIDIPAPEDLMPFAEARGKLPWPLTGQLQSRFGEHYGDGNLQRQGVIIGAGEGAPVRAVHPGRVVFADWLRGSGFLVVIDHGQGYLSLYAHNQALAKQTGDWANRGEIIGTAGANAGLDEPGIYFEVRHNGQAQDPERWCTR